MNNPGWPPDGSNPYGAPPPQQGGQGQPLAGFPGQGSPYGHGYPPPYDAYPVRRSRSSGWLWALLGVLAFVGLGFVLFSQGVLDGPLEAVGLKEPAVYAGYDPTGRHQMFTEYGRQKHERILQSARWSDDCARAGQSMVFNADHSWGTEAGRAGSWSLDQFSNLTMENQRGETRRVRAYFTISGNSMSFYPVGTTNFVTTDPLTELRRCAS